MTGAAASVPPLVGPQPDLIEAFEIRAWARAYLVAAGEMSLQEAVDALQAAAENGLVQLVGQDTAQEIMADAFGYALTYAHTMTVQPDEVSARVPRRQWDSENPIEAGPSPSWDSSTPAYRYVARDGVASAAELQRDYEQSIRRERLDRGLAASTIEAFKYVVSQRDPNQLRQWLAQRSSAERREFRRMAAQR